MRRLEREPADAVRDDVDRLARKRVACVAQRGFAIEPPQSSQFARSFASRAGRDPPMPR